MDGFSPRLRAALEAQRGADLYRQRQSLAGPQGPRVQIDGVDYLNFCSNDYLGLADHPKIAAAFRAGVERYGVGSGASHLVCGHSCAHRELEEALAEFTGRPRALLFSSGYAANTATLSTLLEPGDRLFQDRLNHASLLDGGRASGARWRRFPHNDTEVLSRWLQATEDNALVAVDGVFSMDGDVAPLAELVRLCADDSRWLMVDDAHGFGVLGERGLGATEEAGLSPEQVPILMATLGKALGTAGAVVVGSEDLIEFLIQRARSYIYTTAMPPAVAVAAREALLLVAEEAWRRTHLQQLVQRLRAGVANIGLTLMPSHTAIQPLVVGTAERALAWSEHLRQAGLLVAAIRPPTVPPGEFAPAYYLECRPQRGRCR
jgi:8-amino-7-oxononanoate synthase